MSQGTKLLTASGEIAPASSGRNGVLVLSIKQGTGASTVRIRKTNVSGSILWEETMDANTHRVISFNPVFLRGDVNDALYCEITATGTTVNILYINSLEGD